jgi:hypothetical protein
MLNYRRILIQTGLNFEVNITGASVAGDVVFQWGKSRNQTVKTSINHLFLVAFCPFGDYSFAPRHYFPQKKI